MKPIRTAVIGTGYLGKFHADKFAQLPDSTLVAVVDTDPANGRPVAERHGVAFHHDYREILDKVDAVSIVVPTSLHHPIARDCLEHGLDVLVEKPITVTVAQADELIAVAERNQRILQVGHLERFNAAMRGIEQCIDKPMFIETHRLAPFKERGIDVDVILDIMIHDIDLILSIVNAPVTGIHAVGVPVVSSDKNDIANARLEFATGCIANITASRISVKEMRKTRIFQQDAYISVNFATQHAEVYRKLHDPEMGAQISYEEVGVDQNDALLEEARSFLQAVQQRTPPVVTGAAGREALRVALEIVHQSESRKASLNL